jgi:hypothetical protein
MPRKSLSPAASAALSLLSTFNEMYSSVRDRDAGAATTMMENMRVTYQKQIRPYLEPHFQENNTVKRAVETYQKLVKV